MLSNIHLLSITDYFTLFYKIRKLLKTYMDNQLHNYDLVTPYSFIFKSFTIDSKMKIMEY